MNSIRIRVLVIGAAALALGVRAETNISHKPSAQEPVSVAVEKGMKWLVSVQGKDGGWGQDGGETSYVRQNERLESNGNDVANTAVAAEALLHAGNTSTSGPYHESLRRAVQFVMEHVERSPIEGLAVTDLNGTQIQRKLGPYIDTFLTSKLLADLDGSMGSAGENARVRASLQKCVAKIQKSQLKDGSWNIAGGWAPILGTSMASQSLFVAKSKGVPVEPRSMARIDTYTAATSAPQPAEASASAGFAVSAGAGGGVVGGAPSISAGRLPSAMAMSADASAVSAGVSLYKRAQELEQLSRTPEDRKKNGQQIRSIESQLADPRFVTGFGSIGGEEFFSYLNISDSLRRAGGPDWERWNSEMKAKILSMQNEDGTWAGHHCITGRVAVTSAAILMLVADREKPFLTTSASKPGATKQ
jgi:hypothetical protein